MTVFGQTLDGQQLFGLISLLVLLAFWIVTLNRERDYGRWLKGRLARKRKVVGGADRSEDDGPQRGPWG